VSKYDGKVDYEPWTLVWVLVAKAEDNVIVVPPTNKASGTKFFQPAVKSPTSGAWHDINFAL
jgi:hypothetical protein